MSHLMPYPQYRPYDRRFNGIHYCFGNNMTEERRVELEQDEEPSLFEERESDER